MADLIDRDERRNSSQKHLATATAKRCGTHGLILLMI